MGKKKRREIPHFNTPIIETHCHLDYLDADQLSQVLAMSSEVGIDRIITIAVSPDNLDKVIQLSRQADNIWTTQGIHPHQADLFDADVGALIRQHLSDPRVVAVGEIGLDYHYDHVDRKVQTSVFEQQLQIAVDHDMPVVVHTREADEDTWAILQNFTSILQRKGVIHSFTSGAELAQRCLGEGFFLGFNGIATFARAENVREIVAATPLEQMLLETDAPYLTPVPYRGKPNAPYFLPFIAEKLAQIKNCEIEHLLQRVRANSLALFFEIAN
ncbi:MAG: TatD family hydrolase [Halieaceae bacterium]|jgi:TatD DNase family protein|nr:TatD family hydrolase [Halieaceae bacterium]